jgi:serine/threonine protein kinase
MPSEEIERGLQYFKDIIESGKILRLSEPRQVNRGYVYLFEVRSGHKEWHFALSRNQISDLPGTKDHHAPANALARSLEKRFRNIDPNLFVTNDGRLLEMDIEWPISPWVTPSGMAAASGVWVSISDRINNTLTKCIVQMTHQQTMPGSESNPYARPAHIINTVRSNVDLGTLTFYANSRDFPTSFMPTRMQVGSYFASPPSIEDYLVNKVWSLGFMAGAGEKGTATWIADPWDAEYLGCSPADMKRAAAILDAQEKILLREDGEFASVGKVLLASGGPNKAAQETRKPTFRTALSEYVSKKTLGEGGSGKVLLVSDNDGNDFALKYLKPDVHNKQKNKRFRNELAFCTRNTHSNIITIEDNGLADLDGFDVPFFVMPVFPKTLRSLMQKKTPPEKLLLLFADVLNGVEHAHNSLIWHRDIKPENILVTDDEERAVVTDFGIAHFDDEYLHTIVDTMPQERLANFRYAAPEQRSKGEVDQRADIYALGLILYEIFTGQLLQGTQHTKIGAMNHNYLYLDPIVESMTCQSPADRLAAISLVREMLLANSSMVLSDLLRKRFDHEASPTHTRSNKPLLATAQYEKKGTALKINAFVRPHQDILGTYTFDTSVGEVTHGTERQVAGRFVETDRRLQDEGFTRMNWSNLSGKRSFDLP